MDEVTRLALEQAWVDGVNTAWELSGEGWNGEYPGNLTGLEAVSLAGRLNPYRKKES